MQNKTRAIGLLRMVMAADLTLWSKFIAVFFQMHQKISWTVKTNYVLG